MSRAVFIFSCFLLFSFGCKCQKEPSKSANGTGNINEKNGGDALARFVVSFYSTGGGIELEQAEKFRKYITDFEKKNNKAITRQALPWGREGEVNYCFTLRELSDEQQQHFINGVKAALKGASRVHYFENAPCMQ